MANTIFITPLLVILYSLSSGAPLASKWDTRGPSTNDDASENGNYSLLGGIVSTTPRLSQIVSSVADGSSNNTLFATSGNLTVVNPGLASRTNIREGFPRLLQVLVGSVRPMRERQALLLERVWLPGGTHALKNSTNQNASAESKIGIKDTDVEREDAYDLINKIIFSPNRRTASQVNSNEFKYFENRINKSPTEGAEGFNVLEMGTSIQSQRLGNTRVSVTARNTLATAGMASTGSSWLLNNLTQKIKSEFGTLEKKTRKARLEKSTFLDFGTTDVEWDSSPEELNDSAQDMTSEDGALVRKQRTESDNFLVEDDIHSDEVIETGRNLKQASLLSGLGRLFKRSDFKSSTYNTKLPETTVVETNDTLTKDGKGSSAFEKLIPRSRRSKESRDESSEVFNSLVTKDAFEKGAVFAAMNKRGVYLTDTPNLKNSVNLGKGNVYRGLFKRRRNSDSPKFDLSNLLLNIDQGEFQPYGKHHKPVENIQTNFVENYIEKQLENIPDRLNMVHINHHVISKTDFPPNEDNVEKKLDNPKVYQIGSSDYRPIKKQRDFMTLYGLKKNSHTNEELNDIFKQVEFEVSGLDVNDRHNHQDLLRNYTKHQVEDIFKKLYFEIFDIDEDKNLAPSREKEFTEKDRDKVFNTNKDQDIIIENDGIRCKVIDEIACKKTPDKMPVLVNEEKAFGWKYNGTNSSRVYFAGIKGIIGLNGSGVSNGKKNSSISFNIMAGCFENITTSKSLSVEDIQNKMNCSKSTLGKGINQNYDGSHGADEKAVEYNGKERPGGISTTSEASPIESVVFQTDTKGVNNVQLDKTSTDKMGLYEIVYVDAPDLRGPRDDKKLSLKTKEFLLPKYNSSQTTSAYILNSVSENDQNLKANQIFSMKIPDDTPKTDITANNDSKTDGKDHVAQISILMNTDVRQRSNGSDLHDSQFIDNHGEGVNANSDNSSVSEKGKGISVEIKSQIDLGERTSNTTRFSENNSLENSPAINKEARQNNQQKAEVIVIEDETAKVFPKPVTVIFRDGGKTLTKTGVILGHLGT